MFSPAGKLRFLPTTCTSAFLWSHFMHPKLKHQALKSFDHSFPHHKLLPPLPKKSCPPKLVLPPQAPIYKNQPVPIYKPKPPVYSPPKVLPPPVPIYKPKPPVPIHKPKPPVYSPPKVLPPPIPIYKGKPLVFHKPLRPPLPKFPPFPKMPCPPLPKLPKIPPKYFHHPKFGK